MRLFRSLFELINIRLSRFFLLFCFLVFYLISFQVIGQTQGYYDSLNEAREWMNQGKISDALALLDKLESNHPGEENLIRVKGQALYWSKDFEAMKGYFRKSISNYPDLYWIKLDFARNLYDLNELDEAKSLLQDCLKTNPSEPEANQKMAEINYWQGGKPKTSYAYLDKILITYPENEQANALKKEIREVSSPYLGISSGYFSDSQPLGYFNLVGRGNFYQSALLQPGFLAEFRSYSIGTNAGVVQVSNKTSFPQTGTSLLLRGGLSYSSDWENSGTIYGAEIRQKLPKMLELSFSADREAYFHTLASLTQEVSPFTIRAAFGREQSESWTGKILFQNSSFEDDNWVNTLGGWVLVPVLKTPIFRFDLGYSFNLSDSKEVRFSEDLPIKNTGNTTDFGEVIPGSYTPYFTPINQQIHGALGKISLNFSPKVQLSLSGNLGIYAQIDNPNMVYYGNNPGNGNSPVSREDIYLILVETTYNPMDFAAVLNWNSSPKSGLSLSYNYQRTIFFESNFIILSYNFRIWND